MAQEEGQWHAPTGVTDAACLLLPSAMCLLLSH